MSPLSSFRVGVGEKDNDHEIEADEEEEEDGSQHLISPALETWLTMFQVSCDQHFCMISSRGVGWWWWLWW